MSLDVLKNLQCTQRGHGIIFVSIVLLCNLQKVRPFKIEIIKKNYLGMASKSSGWEESALLRLDLLLDFRIDMITTTTF